MPYPRYLDAHHQIAKHNTRNCSRPFSSPVRAAPKTTELMSFLFLLLVASSSDSLGLRCVCGRRDFGHLDVLGGSISRVLGSVFLCLIFLGLFGIVLCGLLLFNLLRVFLVGGFAVVDVFLFSSLALLVWWLGAWSRVSFCRFNGFDSKVVAAAEALSAAACA